MQMLNQKGKVAVSNSYEGDAESIENSSTFKKFYLPLRDYARSLGLFKRSKMESNMGNLRGKDSY